MTPKQAIRILMLSPCYWRLDLPARKRLVHDYCISFKGCATQTPPRRQHNPAQAFSTLTGREYRASSTHRFLVRLPLQSGSWPNRACHHSSGS